MVGDIVAFVKNELNASLNKSAGVDGPAEDQVVLLSGEKLDPIQFKLGAVTLMLINVEEDNTLRVPDRFIRRTANGDAIKVRPEIHLNLYIIFISKFKDYVYSLNTLSNIIRFFQTQPFYTKDSNPELPQDVEKLFIEMHTLPLAQQNELWGTLRTSYHPSVMYKVNTIVFKDKGEGPMPKIEERKIEVVHKE